jgi:hypothetical protein
MAGHYAKPSIPATLAAAHSIRAAAGLPHSGGTRPEHLDTGLQRAYGVNPASCPKGDIPARAATHALIVPLNAGSLPSHLRRWQPSFAGGHTVCIAGVREGKLGWFDPLAPGGYSGEWVRWSDIDQAVWSSGTLMLPKAPPPPPSSSVTLRYGGTATHRGRYRVKLDRCRIRSKPDTDADIVRMVDRGATFACAQTTETGTRVDGSRRWYGTADGRKWIHSSLVEAAGHSTGSETVR